MKVYHVTRTEKLDSIFKVGLIPQVGYLSSTVGDPEGIYLFASENDLVENVGNWMWLYFTENDLLSALEIELPYNFPLEKRNNWELVSKMPIEPKYIKYFCKV